MLIDLQLASKNTNYSEFDFLIIGAGVAGTVLAKSLAGSGKKIALIEGGGSEYTELSQNLYKGLVTGDPYFDLDVTRLRFFGGSSNHWTGMCRSFEKIDFEREYLGNIYKWPIKFNDIEKYKKKACEILEVPSEFDDNDEANSNIKSIDFNMSTVNFKEKYYKEFLLDKNISLFINANLTKFNGQNRKIKSINVQSLNGNKLELSAKKIIVATGGIENCRILLWIDKFYPDLFFEKNLPIGKYWMEHPHFTLGKAIIDKKKISNTYYSLKGDLQKQLEILNCGFRIIHLDEINTTELIRDLICVAPKLGNKLAKLAGKNLVCGAVFKAAWEQSPSINSAISLTKELDGFGIPRANLHWKKNKLDRTTLKKSIAAFNEWILNGDNGRLNLYDWISKDLSYPADGELGGHHHMGGTRMHESKIYGVVNSDCKVYGSDNLYVAGSSLFTTGGHNNPTLPIVQLALRLSEHLTKII
jgi:hypothetical protein